MRTPEESYVFIHPTETIIRKSTSEIAGDVITELDKDYTRADVVKIAEWIQYLSTQD